MHEEDSPDSRTLFCGNLSENVTEALLYELFLQAGPLDRVSVPKKDGRPCSFGFITYSHMCSVPYAIELFSGTRLFDRDLRVKVRDGPANRAPQHAQPQSNHQQQPHHHSTESMNRSGSRSNNNSFEAPNPFSNNASLRSGFNAAHSHSTDMRPSNNQRKPQLEKAQLANINQLLQMGSQMLTSGNANNDNQHSSGGRFNDEHDDRGNYDQNTARPYRRNGPSSYRRDNDPYDNHRRHNNERSHRDRNNRSGGSSGRNRY